MSTKKFKFSIKKKRSTFFVFPSKPSFLNLMTLGKVAIIASGLMVQESLKAYDLLENKPTVIDIPTIKPIDKELIIETAKTHDVIVTVEEHNVYGGLGSAVSEVLAPEGIACRQYMLGMQDTFGRSGKPKDLLDYYGLDAQHFAEEIKKINK